MSVRALLDRPQFQGKCFKGRHVVGVLSLEAERHNLIYCETCNAELYNTLPPVAGGLVAQREGRECPPGPGATGDAVPDWKAGGVVRLCEICREPATHILKMPVPVADGHHGHYGHMVLGPGVAMCLSHMNEVATRGRRWGSTEIERIHEVEKPQADEGGLEADR